MQALLDLCLETSRSLLQGDDREPAAQKIQRDPALKKRVEAIRERLNSACGEVYTPKQGTEQKTPTGPLHAVTWNIERGKNFKGLRETLLSDPGLQDADLYFLTEVDWGMARSENRNVAAELGEALNRYAYFAPSYYNLTLGHGSERHLGGENTYGLHGKAILSRFPLENLRAIPMSNTIDKLRSKEARLGEKRALVADLRLGDRGVALACTHLDAFSSPAARAEQLHRAVLLLRESPRALIAGDWNTNTLNTTHGPSILWSVLKQIVATGPQAMIRKHYPGPQRKFDRPLFQMLQNEGFDFENCNEPEEGTYDLVSNDKDLGQMARDQFPDWIVRWINRQIEKGGGKISLKLDWFAGKGLRYLEKKVIPVRPAPNDPKPERPSDHHPVSLRFEAA
ncbi:MAG: endonuclease/exonuclease/phosphatase family protein [Deltaproteobacteria bacterium]|nr:endonuclease/exonuclease/phosphatase family protein [Deltaproteobacteria bacterium]